MGTFFSTIMAWIIGSNVARLFSGIGVALISELFLSGFVNSALNSITSQFGGLSADIGNLFSLLGFGSYLTIIGTAFLTRVSIQQLSKTWAITATPTS